MRNKNILIKVGKNKRLEISYLDYCNRMDKKAGTNRENADFPKKENVVYLELQHSSSISRLFMRTCRSTRKALARMTDDGLSRERIIFTTKS